MIKVRNNHFLLETKNTVYILHYNEAGLLIHDYYGKKIPVRDFASLEMKTGGGSDRPSSTKAATANMSASLNWKRPFRASATFANL